MTTMCADVFSDGTVRPGGEALNFAAAASSFEDVDVVLIGALGDDGYGHTIISSVKDKPIDLSGVHIVKGGRTASQKTYLTDKGDRYFRSDSWDGGVHDSYRLTEGDMELAAGADIVFITYSSPNFDDVLDLRRKGSFKLAVDFDVQRDFTGFEDILPYVDFFFISGEKRLLTQFRQWSVNYDGLFNITLAELGSVTYKKGKEYRVNAVQVDRVVDTTGCGDSYHAAFVCDYALNGDVMSAMKSGSRAAAVTIGRLGGF
ncbi:MAG: carbohydrate kinase [Ruminococcus sp.]|nr:carbohydrate kinase [Ruminococcus sp.]